MTDHLFLSRSSLSLLALLGACAAPSDDSVDQEAVFSAKNVSATAPDKAQPISDTWLPPDQDPFYTPPALSAQPGDILRMRDAKFTNDPFFNFPYDDVNAWELLYQSTDALDAPMAVSGSLFVPTTPWTGKGERPLISYAVGTRGLGDLCAPSYTLMSGLDYEGDIIRSLLDKGWAVAITDYQGLGTPGLHTYMVGPSEGHAILDIARAAERLDGSTLGANTPIGLTGYSQGGGAAGWAAEIAASYAPELIVKGSAIGGVPSDLKATAEFLEGGPFVAFALMAALGIDAAYPELNLKGMLNDYGKQVVPAGETACLASLDGITTLTAGFAFTTFADYTTTNPLDTAAWQKRLEGLKLGKAKPSAPIYQYHGDSDEIVPFDQAAELRKTWCKLGADITWEVYPFTEHALGIAWGPDSVIPYLADRFDGKPTKPNCDQP